MFTKRKRLMFNEDPFGGDFDSTNAGAGSPGGADEPEYDFSTFGTEAPAEVTTPENKDNPAWEAYLQDVPDTMRGLVTPAFKKWDQEVSAKFEQHAQDRKRYDPYNEFVDNQVDPNAIRASMQFLHQLTNDPVAFYKELDQTLRENPQYASQLSPAQKQAIANAADDDSLPDDPYQQKIDELAKTQNAFQQEWQRREQAQKHQQYVASAHDEFNRDYAAIEQQHGTLSGEFKARIAQEAIALETRFGRPATIREGFESLRQFGEGYAQSKRKAPRVIGGGGGQQARRPVDNPGKMSEQDRLNSVLSIIAEHKDN